MAWSSMSDPAAEARLAALLAEVRACRLCIEAPRGQPLPHLPRPVVRGRASATLAICGQAPGTRVHASGLPFSDPSGVRLREWMGVTEATFYDEGRIAIVPMGFCFPGLSAAGSDLPPRRECAPRWRAEIFAALPRLTLILLIGRYAQDWHAPMFNGRPLDAVVRETCTATAHAARPRLMALPHPSWRNNGWLKRNPWFDADVVPALRAAVRACLALG
jgi:uracil-DNA glycosylase